MVVFEKIASVIETISNKSGWVVCWILPCLVAVMSYEVIARYIFNAPTIWAWETSIYCMGLLTVLGGAHGLYMRSHVAVDVVTSRLNDRTRAIIEVIMYTLFFIFMIALIWKGGLWAIDSTIRGEATDTQWRPIIWPLKLSLPIGATLLFLQGCVDYSRQWRTVVTGKRFERA